MHRSSHIILAGAGIFGVTGALALRRRGHAVTLIDPGPLPHPLAESTDISKVVRVEYGSDEAYTALMERALAGWRRWNTELTLGASGRLTAPYAPNPGRPAPLFHETGVAFLCRSPMAPGGFEHDSHALLTRRGHPLERLDAAAIAARFPAWRAGAFVDGYYNPAGGYAESGRVVAALLDEAERAGVMLRAGEALAGLVEARGDRVTGVALASGGMIAGDQVIVAAGSWTPHLVPAMAPHLRSVGQPVFHLAPDDPAPYRAERFPVFGADIGRTGYYGFPIHRDGVVKIANHGVGRPMHPSSSERTVSAGEEAALRAFLKDTFPGLADARIAHTRVCVYCDTWDEHFWIARDPAREGLVIAAGGSGHGFKFAPVLGDLIADAAEGADNPALEKFRWRPEVRHTTGEEAARHHG